MSARVTPATRALSAQGIAFMLLDYDYDPDVPAIGLAAAAALGIDPARLFKTLVVTTAEGRPLLAALPSPARLDLKAAAPLAGTKVLTLAPRDLAERVTGSVIGGISPLGSRRPLPVLIDQSALDHETILVNGGRRGLQIRVAPADLIRVAGAKTGRLSAG